MITKAIGPTVLAMATLLAVPATARAQLNPALIGVGAEVWTNNCGRCHNIRPPTERTDAEWGTIVMHMRARANLTRDQADAVLAYLQATNTAEGAAAAPSAARLQGQPPRDDSDGSVRGATPTSRTGGG